MVRLSYDDDVAAYEALADAVLPEAGDNCAIARRLLKAGTKIDLGGEVRVTLSRDVREGFRFATRLVTAGEELTSWGLGFGAALVDIKAGALLMNRGTLDSLACRTGLDLPEANFKDLLRAVDETEFGRPRRRAARKDVRDGEPETFQGYLRPGARGVGTRNWIVVVPTTAAAAPWADALARKFDGVTTPANVDGVASLAHTEGSGGSGETAHDDRLDRTLAGLVAHPNVFAALVVQERNDGGGAVILEAARTAFRGVPGLTEIVTLEAAHDLEALLEDTFTMLRDSWLPAAAAAKRTACPLSELKVALQCGGSDAFSGVSGNPTVGWCAKEVVKLGGTALLAETDELMGAEAYVLERASPAVQRRFLALVRRYRGYLAAHGQTAEANPSGGNKLRGLYNIALKSLGAAKKKHRETPLDCVIEYAEALKGGNRGYVFMDSPGNDLESVAGQVAAGCNVVHFVTGNGSVTNFPFVPTIKVVTTTARYDMLQNDMDLNAGRYQEGTPISVLGAELFQLSLSVAGGDRTKGERAGHSQLSIWRAPSQMEFDADSLTALAAAHGQPLAVRAAEAPGAAKQRRLDWFVPTRPVALVLPTSVCSSQVCAKIASGIAAGLSAAPAAGPVQGPGEAEAFRVAAVPHTEGCGCGHAGDGELLFVRVVVGHLLHPNVVAAAVVEHGCEKTHNEWVKQRLRLDQQAQCGWFSIQLGGGNDKTIADVRDYVLGRVAVENARARARPANLATADRGGPAVLKRHRLTVGVILTSPDAACVRLAAQLCAATSSNYVIVADSSGAGAASSVVAEACLAAGVQRTARNAPSLGFAQRPEVPGVHVMKAVTTSVVEVTTALAAAAADVVVVLSPEASGAKRRAPAVVAGHPFVPVLHCKVSSDASASAGGADAVLGPGDVDRLVSLVARTTAAGGAKPKAAAFAAFQIARGPTGVSA